MRSKHLVFGLVGLLLLVSGLVGCGSSQSNNGNATDSLIATQFFADVEGSIGLTRDVVSLGEAFKVAYLGLQNINTLQGVRVDRLEISYDVVGGGSIPSTVEAANFFLGAAAEEPIAFGAESTLPNGIAQLESEAIIGFYVIDPEYLAFNTGSLPQTPYTIIANVRASGVTTSGDRQESNVLSLPIEVLDGLAG